MALTPSLNPEWYQRYLEGDAHEAGELTRASEACCEVSLRTPARPPSDSLKDVSYTQFLDTIVHKHHSRIGLIDVSPLAHVCARKHHAGHWCSRIDIRDQVRCWGRQ